MSDSVQSLPWAGPRGFEEKGEETPWCVQCANFLKWPYHDECIGCLTVGGRPADTVTLRTVHWDTAVLHAIIRRKVAVWEQRHPGWELAPDFARYFEESTHPSRYVDRETGIGRKLAWTRFRVERRHPLGRTRMGQVIPSVRVPVTGRWWPQLGRSDGAVGALWAGEPAEPTPPRPEEPEEPDDVPEPVPPVPAPQEEAPEEEEQLA